MDAQRQFVGFIFLISLVGIASNIQAEDWPTYQLNNNRNPHSFEVLKVARFGQQWRWKSPSPPSPAWSGPAKWDAYSGVRDLKSMRNYDPVFHTVAVGNRVFLVLRSTTRFIASMPKLAKQLGYLRQTVRFELHQRFTKIRCILVQTMDMHIALLPIRGRCYGSFRRWLATSRPIKQKS